jgi:quinol-cytochrome oxidoreductase complex cytochrome b subunit
MLLERLKPDLNTPEKTKEAYSIFSSWLLSNFLFFFVIFYAIYISSRLGTNIGSTSFLIVIIIAITFLYFSRKLSRSLLKDKSVRVNHIVFYVLCAMNVILLTWIVFLALS